MTGRALAPPRNASTHDLIATPPELARHIVEHFQPTGSMLDPCRGKGAFYEALVARGRGEVDWCEITEDRDFFTSYSGDEITVSWTITNPPWSKFRSFLLRSMEISDHVVFLGTLTHFVTRARLRDVREHGFGLREALLLKEPTGPWPASGFQLAAVHLERDWLGPLTFTGPLDY